MVVVAVADCRLLADSDALLKLLAWGTQTFPGEPTSEEDPADAARAHISPLSGFVHSSFGWPSQCRYVARTDESDNEPFNVSPAGTLNGPGG